MFSYSKMYPNPSYVKKIKFRPVFQFYVFEKITFKLELLVL